MENTILKHSKHSFFDLMVVSKQFSKMLPLANFKDKPFSRLYVAFPENYFNFAIQTFAKKQIPRFSNNHNPQKTRFSTHRKILTLTKFGFRKIFESFTSPSQKTISTLSLQNLQKIEIWHLQTLRTFAFDLKIASKTFSKMLPMIKVKIQTIFKA